MKTLLLLSILGLALVSADLQSEDHYTEEADVVAVDDSADKMDNRDDTRRSRVLDTLTAKFEFGDALTADIKVTQSKPDKKKNIAKWTAVFDKFDSDICPKGELNWHVHQYPVSTTASSNMATMTAPIAYFASDGSGGPYFPDTVLGHAATSTTSDGALRLDWALTGLDESSSGGIHVHYGTSCDNETTVKGDAPADANKGHYYLPDATPDASEDPWGPVVWSSKADGSANGFQEITKAELGGLNPGSAYNRVVVVHNSDGQKVGCGVLAISAPGCGSGVTGGHYDPTFACGTASQNNANGICSYSAFVKGTYACEKWQQSACEIGDQSGKMGKLYTKSDRMPGRILNAKDYWMQPIANLEGKSMVLHCCSAAGCGARLACANLE